MPAGYRGIDDEKEILYFNNIINLYCKLNDRVFRKLEKMERTHITGGYKNIRCFGKRNRLYVLKAV